ncbi:MAG: hypothetical protein EXQ56_09385 [Acidobacteria bacterium]|nr:hypothetical protein [Acidobacteriota bacterium]
MRFSLTSAGIEIAGQVTGVDSGGSGIPVAWRPDLIPGGILEPDPVEGNLRTFRAGDIFFTPRNVSGGPLANSMPDGGSLGRNTFRGPSFANWNVNFAKTLEVSEHLRILLRGDIINIWNHRNFGNPVASINSPAFGSNTSDPGNRAAMLSAKISF